MTNTALEEITEYGEHVEGDAGNYFWKTRFNITDGYVGITQSDAPHVNDTSRVLLSPDQVKALIRFVKDHQ